MDKELITACAVEGILMTTGSLRRLALEVNRKCGRAEALGFINAHQETLNKRINKIRQLIETM
jgi:hypothetical protein